jgi:hypothetical protein
VRQTFNAYILKWAGAILFLFLSSVSTAQYDNITTDTTVVAPDDLGDDGTYPVKKYFIVNDSSLSVQERELSPELIKKYQEDEDFWYANATIDPATGKSKPVVKRKESGQKKQGNSKDGAIQEEEPQSRSLSGGAALLLWILIIGVFIAALVMYLGNSSIGLFRKKNRRTNEAGEMEEIITEDIFAINYQRDIDRAASQGNYRFAIRLMFLRSLKNMSEKNIIRYKQDKTNLDYLMELSPTAYYNGFFRVTRNYEYSWYGQFPVSSEAYQLIRGEFDQFDKELRSA